MIQILYFLGMIKTSFKYYSSGQYNYRKQNLALWDSLVHILKNRNWIFLNKIVEIKTEIIDALIRL